MRPIRLAVLSDLHAAPRAVDTPTSEVKLFCDDNVYAPNEHPIAALKLLIDEEHLKADFVVCPGDMTNRASSQAVTYVWRELNSLKAKFFADELIATVGNHDIDSRDRAGNDFPRELLMQLHPRFPTQDDRLADHYWAHGYCIICSGSTRFLVLNSCWLHESHGDINRGAVTKYTLEKLRQDLAATAPNSQLDIAVCHHHPHPHSELGLGADDVMRNGQQFLDLLADQGSWLVIHGHKHHPKIETAAGQASMPIVFACGSFSGRLEGLNASVSHNYFHLIEAETKSDQIRGTVRSWAWVPGNGWRRFATAERQKFSCEFGFGFCGDLNHLVEAVNSQMAGKSQMNWTELCKRVGELKFLMPKQFELVKKKLHTQYNLNVAFDDYGLPEQIGPQPRL